MTLIALRLITMVEIVMEVAVETDIFFFVVGIIVLSVALAAWGKATATVTVHAIVV
jgi:hypothetical protein